MKSHPLLPTQPLVTITNEEITLVSRGRGHTKLYGVGIACKEPLYLPQPVSDCVPN
jgi:hypothetical protein